MEMVIETATQVDLRHSQLTAEDCEFIECKLPTVAGWLLPGAAYFTAYLLNFQSANDVRGPALEIGVYHGKYLLLLLHCVLKDDGWVGGYDIFEQCHPETAWRHAEEMFGSRERMAL